jgi:hypothetical protein
VLENKSFIKKFVNFSFSTKFKSFTNSSEKEYSGLLITGFEIHDFII